MRTHPGAGATRRGWATGITLMTTGLRYSLSTYFWCVLSVMVLLSWQDETSCHFHPVKDLWRHNETFSGPELSLQNGPSCSQDSQHPDSETCVFEEDILMQEVLQVLRAHDPAQPLFMFYSMHLVHMPLQVRGEEIAMPRPSLVSAD